MKAVISVFLTLAPLTAISQFDSLGIGTPWCKGSITLLDGKNLQGFIQFNEELQLIRYKEDMETEDIGISQDNFRSMVFFDPRVSSDRRFVVINFKYKEPKESLESKMRSMRFYDNDNWLEGTDCFEVVKEFTTFAALSQKSVVDMAIRKSSDQMYVNGRWVPKPGGATARKVGYEQYEKIFFIGEDGKLNVVLGLNYLEKDKENFLARKSKTFIDRNLITEFMIDHWSEVEEYIKSNDLDLRLKEDFIKVLNFYSKVDN